MPLGESLPHWSTDYAVNITNRLLHGSNSYLDFITDPVAKGPDARFYVRTIRGLYPGQFMNIHGGPWYGGGVTRACIKTIGFDAVKGKHYFTADTSIDHVPGAFVQNKNNEGVIWMRQDANCDEQTYDLMLNRNQYALGDTSMYFARYKYMSNIHSAAGDENGNGFSRNADGTKDITIQRFWWGAKSMGSPTLYREDNCTWDGHVRPLSYVIAPGTYVVDVGRAVPGKGFKPDNVLGLAPYRDMNTPMDFAKGDAIEQAVGPDPFKPTPIRLWMKDNVPSVFPAPGIDLCNESRGSSTARYAGIWIRGGARPWPASPPLPCQACAGLPPAPTGSPAATHAL